MAKQYVVTDGQKILSVHSTKKEAHEVGMAHRRAGRDAFAHSAEDFEKHIAPGALAKWSGGNQDMAKQKFTGFNKSQSELNQQSAKIAEKTTSSSAKLSADLAAAKAASTHAEAHDTKEAHLAAAVAHDRVAAHGAPGLSGDARAAARGHREAANEASGSKLSTWAESMQGGGGDDERERDSKGRFV